MQYSVTVPVLPEGVVDRNVLDVIRQVILEEAGRLGLEVERVILFGSRARGDAREDSDYDILVVVKGSIHRKLKIKFYGRVHRRLVETLETPVDLVVVSSSYWREYSRVPGTILYPAAHEGVKIA